MSELQRIFRPHGDRVAPFALMGHFLAGLDKQDDTTRYDALLFLLAASRGYLSLSGDTPRYPPLSRLLARQYWRYKQYQRAIDALVPLGGSVEQ